MFVMSKVGIPEGYIMVVQEMERDFIPNVRCALRVKEGFEVRIVLHQ